MYSITHSEFAHDVTHSKKTARSVVGYTALFIVGLMSFFILGQQKALAQTYHNAPAVTFYGSEQTLKNLEMMTFATQEEKDETWAMLRLVIPAENERCHTLLDKWQRGTTNAGMKRVSRVCRHEINRVTSMAPRMLMDPMPTRAGLVPMAIFPNPKEVQMQTVSNYERTITPTPAATQFERSYEALPTSAAVYYSRPTSRSIYKAYTLNRSRSMDRFAQ